MLWESLKRSKSLGKRNEKGKYLGGDPPDPPALTGLLGRERIIRGLRYTAVPVAMPVAEDQSARSLPFAMTAVS